FSLFTPPKNTPNPFMGGLRPKFRFWGGDFWGFKPRKWKRESFGVPRPKFPFWGRARAEPPQPPRIPRGSARRGWESLPQQRPHKFPKPALSRSRGRRERA
uniref:Uncharacterized protein n=1 Tax=Taeniopygia guttata TaxID=59729 RepID=A0A674HPI9_TAEGU